METVTISAVAEAMESMRGLDDAPPTAAPAGSQQRFADLLEPRDDSVPGSRFTGEPERPSGSLATLGDAILRQLDQVSNNYRSHKDMVTRAVHDQAAFKDDVKSVFHLLQLQMQLAEHTLEVELVSKGVSKFTGTIDQLSKLQ